MEYVQLGNTGMKVSRISFGASSLGSVFRKTDDASSIEAVHKAFELGINYFDVAPAYGATKAEQVLGRALQGIPRSKYYISTKVGKNTNEDGYGKDSFDYSRAGILKSLEQSAQRLGVHYFDIVHLHDIEYNSRKNTEWALEEGLHTLFTLKKRGSIGAVGIGMYPLDLWKRVLEEGIIDVGLSHNLYCLNDNRLLELLPLAEAKRIGLINASPFASGLLTTRGAPNWHPASKQQRAVFSKAARYCEINNTTIEQLALQFSCSHPDIATTMFSSADPHSVQRNIAWSQLPLNQELLEKVQQLLKPVSNQNWKY
jgi:aryl-alcohol dehydrogenase-like predicted oxidoreductase